MQERRQIQRFPWGTADQAQVLIVHFGSKSTPMIAQQLRQIGLCSRVIHAAEVASGAGQWLSPQAGRFSLGETTACLTTRRQRSR